MVTYLTGNLFSSNAQIIAHGCNCKGAFGSGVAGQIRKIYPGAYTAYVTKHKKEGWKLGDVQLVEIGEGKFPLIANCATQNGYGYTDGQVVFADYNAIKGVLKTLKDIALPMGYKIAIPRIGAGLAGGDWNVIDKIICTVFGQSQVEIEVWTL